MTARDVAREFLRPYVERGDSLAALKASHMGHYGNGTWVSIGGYLVPGDRSTHCGPEKLLVLRMDGVTVNQVFALRDLYDEIMQEQTQPRLF